MFAITRKIVYKWRGVGDGVRNGVEDEVLSVGWLGCPRGTEREKEKERQTRGYGSRIKERPTDGGRGRREGNDRRAERKEEERKNFRSCDDARFARAVRTGKDFESKIDYREVM